MFRNTMPRYEILSEDAMAALEAGWRRLISEVGVEFLSDRALDLFREAGQRVEDNKVFFDPEFVLEQAAKAPREFDVFARNPAHSIHIGGDTMAFGAVYGPPFVREGAVRRDATMDDFRNFTKLAQAFDVLDSAGGVICEPNDAPLDSRHLDMTYALQTLTDKIYMGNVVSGVKPATPSRWARSSSVAGGHRGEPGVHLADQTATRRCAGTTGCLDALSSTSRRSARRSHPFHLDGRDVSVTIPAALVQQIAEALSGIALTQRIRPGAPVISARSCPTSTCSPAHRRSAHRSPASPALHGQIARRFGLALPLRRWAHVQPAPGRPGPGTRRS
jgi:trimethylamine--corrinoid protein Co-methyltransferase